MLFNSRSISPGGFGIQAVGLGGGTLRNGSGPQPPPAEVSKHSSGQEALSPGRKASRRDGILSTLVVPGDTTDLSAHTAKGGTIWTQTCQSVPPAPAAAQGSQRGDNPTSSPGLRGAPPSPPTPKPLEEHFTRGCLPNMGPIPQPPGGSSRVPLPHNPVSSIRGSAGLPSPSPPASFLTPSGLGRPLSQSSPQLPQGWAGKEG